MPRVLNRHRDAVPDDAVYIGRPSRWGNPYSHLGETQARWRVANRAEAVSAYQRWLESQPELLEAARDELAGRDLVCWCAPAACHGDVLLRVANPDLGLAPLHDAGIQGELDFG